MSPFYEKDPEFDDDIPKRRPGRRFELAIALVFVGVFVPLFYSMSPCRRSAIPAARLAQCVNNLKQIALALHNYEQANKALPPAFTVDAKGRPLHSWRALILPYLGQEPLYSTIDLSKPWNDPANAKAMEIRVPVFRCPEQIGPENTTTYLAVVTPGSCLMPNASRRLDEITDSHASTLLVIESGEGDAIPWMAPADADELRVMSIGPKKGLHHRMGTNACCVDGDVRYLRASTAANVRRALISIAGNDDAVAKEW